MENIIDEFRKKAVDNGIFPDGITVKEIEEFVMSYVEAVFCEYDIPAKVIDVVVYGSRINGAAKYDSDIDVIVEYESNFRLKEYVVFNLLRDIYFHGVCIDINPINRYESGSMAEYLLKVADYEKKALNN